MKPNVKIALTIVSLLFAANVFPQAPNISYPGGPFTFSAGSVITPLSVSNSGGAIAINGQTTTLAGSGSAGYANGSGATASFNEPLGAVVDASGNIYVTDAGNEVIRKITPLGMVSTFAGTGAPGSADGTGTAASFYHPLGMCIDAAGNIYVADENNNMIRKITPAGVVTTIAGQTGAGFIDGAASVAKFNLPCGVAVDAGGNVYVADYDNNAIRKITPSGTVSTFAGNTSGTSGSANGTGIAATFNHPLSVAIDASGNLYVADRLNYMIRKITSAGVVTTLAGQTTAGFADGMGTAAKFSLPNSIAMDNLGNMYIADETNNRIRKIVIATGAVSTLSGTGAQGSANSIGSATTFNYPFGIAADATNNLYVCDLNNNMIREVVSTAFTINPSLPAGLTFNWNTGAITGTPTTAGTPVSCTITAYSPVVNSNNSTTASIGIDAAGSVNPSAAYNSITTYTPEAANLTTSTGLNNAATDKTKVEINVQYFDGLSRVIQTVQAKGSPLGYDMVQPVAYDQYGRQPVQYLPYTPQTGVAGTYRSAAISTDQNAFYVGPPGNSGVTAIQDPFSQTGFEMSPESRPLEQGAPGAAWQPGISGTTHTVKMIYTANNSISFTTDSVNGRQVAWYDVTVNPDQSRTLVVNAASYYAAGSLTVKVTKDENWASGRGGTTEEYGDLEGHTILIRKYNYKNNALEVLSTYYVYDDKGNLAFVLPPAMGADTPVSFNQTQLNNLAYQYTYDDHSRTSGKKLPGRAWDYIVYNYIDQPVATQDPNQRTNNQWLFTKYDAIGRPVMTFLWNDNNTAISQAALQGVLNNYKTNLYETPVSTGNGYTNAIFPTTSIVNILTLTYYDSYANIPGLPTSLYAAPAGASVQTCGLATARLTAVLNTPANMLWDVMYYDNLGHMIKTYHQHYLGGTLNNGNYDAITNTYSFTNQISTTTRQHWNTASTSNPLVTVANKYIYDHMGRKLKTWEQITNGSNTPNPSDWTVISQTDYNEIGQVIKKQLHSKDSLNFLQNITYTYNERGWLTQASASLFEMQLQYNNPGPNVGLQYNGNIASQSWGTQAAPNTNNYTYSYDELNRLTAGTGSTGYTENQITYNQAGDITALNRYVNGNAAAIDQLTYTYSNTYQLFGLNDASSDTGPLGMVHGTTSYNYDGNGNLKTATNSTNNTRNKSFTYNLLNLPLVATVQSGTVTYTYDAAGNKLRKVSTVLNNTTDYINGIQYDGATTPALSFIRTEEGKAVPNTSGGYDYTYFLCDHLGNTRITFDTQSGSAVVQQQDDYYPFGTEIAGSVVSTTKNEYLYNKKELQEELTEYDYGARFYDPVVARWTSIDPLAEKSRSWTPYNYAENNAIRNIDPDGRADEGGPEYEDGWEDDGNPNMDWARSGHYEISQPAILKRKLISGYAAALLARASYPDWKGGNLDGWIQMGKGDEEDMIPGVKWTDEKSSFYSSLFYKREEDGSTSFAVGFAGSRDWTSWGTDFTQLVGMSSQYDIAAKNSTAIYDFAVLQDAPVTFVGHSLGGGLAAFSSALTGLDGITFNAAHISYATRWRYGLTGDSFEHVTAYVLTTDPVNWIQRQSWPLSDYAQGHIVRVKAKTWHQLWDGHDLENFIDLLKPKK